MPDSKITALASIGTGTDPANDPLVIVDVSDVAPGGMSATGTTKKVTLNQLLATSPTATLASATISGDLTAARLIVTGGTIPTNGLWLPTTNTLEFSANGLAQYRIAPLGVFNWYDGAGGTRMTLNSTGLGVGMSPLTDRLTIFGSAGVNVSGGFADISFRNSPGTAIQRIRYTDGSGTLTIGSPLGTSYPVELGGNTTTRAITIDASSNVGIGVTPSAWKANHKALQFGPFSTGYGSIYTDDSGNTWFNSLNFQSATTRQYISTGNAAAYRLTAAGQHQWYTDSVGGVAGGTVSFTQAMTLDASGRLLVGKTTGVNSIETVGAGVDGRGTVTGVSTVATTIYTIKQSATAAMCVVFGDDGTNGFCDIVLFLATVAPKVVSSQTLYGSPAARTYSASTTNLQLALASGTLSIRTAALSTLNT